MKRLVSRYDEGKDGATGARHGQWALSLTIDALGGWSEKDLRWWIVDEERERW